MPIGVPKVAYRLPGASSPEWIDLYNRLYRERTIFMGQDVNDEISNQIIGVLLYLNGENEKQPIYLYINSPGGSVTAGIGIYDTMQHVECDVVTICVGLAASMGSLVLAAGVLGQRIALPHTRIMIHQPAGGSKGQAYEIGMEAYEVMRIRHRLAELYARRTGQTADKIFDDMNRDSFMGPQEAKVYGLVDQVVESNPFMS
jgi:ATP-dependent Clp protease, protease subunit